MPSGMRSEHGVMGSLRRLGEETGKVPGIGLGVTTGDCASESQCRNSTSKILSLRYSIGQQMGFVFRDRREKGFVDEMNDVYGA